jgi:Na+/melibiose symporter-like transporter
MKLFALPLLAILSVAAFAATPFTQGSNQFCTYHLYSFASRYTCTLIPSTNPTSGGTTSSTSI